MNKSEKFEVSSKQFIKLLEQSHWKDKRWDKQYIIVDSFIVSSEINARALYSLSQVNGDMVVTSPYLKQIPHLEYVGGNCDLFKSNIKALPNLKHVSGDFKISGSKIESLPLLEIVGGNLDAMAVKVKEFPELEIVGGDLLLLSSKVQNLPKIQAIIGRFITDAVAISENKKFIKLNELNTLMLK